MGFKVKVVNDVKEALYVRVHNEEKGLKKMLNGKEVSYVMHAG